MNATRPSTPPTGRTPTAELGSRRPHAPGPPEDAGRLDVADQVVEKVAGHAVTLVSGAAAAPAACWA